MLFRAVQCARRAAAAAAPACSALRLSTPAFFAPAAAVPRGASLRHFSAAPSAYLELNEGQQKLSAVTAAHPKVLAYFTAAWCGPCKAIAPHFTKLAQDTAAVKFVKVDVDDNGVTAEEAGISAVPTFKVFHNDKVTAQFSGAKIDALQAAVKALVEAK